jgi:hypothetical protein
MRGGFSHGHFEMARALECDLVYGLVPWQRSLEDRAMELVEQELWRKRYGRATRS